MAGYWDSETDTVNCGGAVKAKKKLKKNADEILKKNEHEEEFSQSHSPSTPQSPKDFLFIPPNGLRKKVKELAPEKWRAAFDSEGRLVGVHKILKVIRKGGVDPSIRAEVWEFLLGCYEVGATMADRELIRQARRKRYQELLEQCQSMHSSVGTGLLAYTVGSKLMDVRITPKDNKGTLRVQESTNILANSDIDTTNSQHSRPGRSPSFGVKKVNFQEFHQEGASNRITRIGCREDLGDNNECECAESATGNTSSFSHQSIDCKSLWSNDMDREDSLAEVSQLETSANSECMWPGPLPGGVDPVESTNLKLGPGGEIRPDTTTPNHMKNGDSSIQYCGASGTCTSQRKNKNCVRTIPVERDPEKVGKTLWTELEQSFTEPTPSSQVSSSQRVADWLWTLHRIVVDVVRTDKHLEFYSDARNSARMSDVLAVYAWVDPATGYCQGMSDLLSPFIVLYDNDADALWCFESLLKRVRHNFQMEGPIGVMKQLEVLSKIFELTDADMLKHLVLTGADNFLFAFRMLLVLFRRELSFGEALYMWEMMWAADFEHTSTRSLEYQSLEALQLRHPLPKRSFPPEDEVEACRLNHSSELSSPTCTTLQRLHTCEATGIESLRWKALASKTSFCGLRPGRLWHKHRNQMIPRNAGQSERKGDEDISVFCVAAIIEQNRNMLFNKLQSMDDAIKIFNDLEMKMKVHSCMNTAVKLRKQYRTQSSKRVTLERRTTARYQRPS